jgi:GTP-binding protein LepA
MEKLQLNDASLVFYRKVRRFGFRCGFFRNAAHGIQERLEREFNMTVITTVPNVSYVLLQKILILF